MLTKYWYYTTKSQRVPGYCGNPKCDRKVPAARKYKIAIWKGMHKASNFCSKECWESFKRFRTEGREERVKAFLAKQKEKENGHA